MFEIQKTSEFDAWLRSLSGDAFKKVINRVSNMQLGNFGSCAPVGEGVSESKIDAGPGLRIYFKRTGNTIYLLLNGGDKSTQKRDIKRAKALAAAL